VADANSGCRAAAERARNAGESAKRAQRAGPARDAQIRQGHGSDSARHGSLTADPEAGARRRRKEGHGVPLCSLVPGLTVGWRVRPRYSKRHDPDAGGDGQGLRACQGSRVIAASMGGMADTLTRPAPPVAQGSARPRPVAIVGIGVALWTALLGVACLISLTLAAWVTAARHDDAVRPAVATALQAWLLAHHAGLAIDGATLGIVPLGITAGPLPYGVVAALLTKPAQWGQVRPQPLPALAGAFVLAFICVCVGALREAGQGAVVIGRLPIGVRHAARAGLAAAAVIVAVGALLVVAGLGAHAKRASVVMGSLHGGVSATLLMAVVSIAYVPNLVAWGSAWSVGPGFAVGAKTSVALGGVHLGAVPALPLFAALPRDGAAPALGLLAVVGPIGGGLLAGWVLARVDAQWSWGLAAGAIAGALLGLLAWLSGGPLGPGRMARLGPSAWQVGFAAAVEVGVLAAATSWLIGLRQLRQSRPAVAEV
jgi:hypothetical protein